MTPSLSLPSLFQKSFKSDNVIKLHHYCDKQRRHYCILVPLIDVTILIYNTEYLQAKVHCESQTWTEYLALFDQLLDSGGSERIICVILYSLSDCRKLSGHIVIMITYLREKYRHYQFK